MKEWYEEHFQEDYLRIYAHRDEQKAANELKALVSHLDIKEGQKALDLCCGQGRHSRWLARQGLHVVGVDLSAVLLKEAIEHSLDLSVQYMRADARRLPFQGEMDLVVNLFTSFGYFDDDDENEEMFAQVSKVLKDQGLFLFDYLNPSHVKSHLVPFSHSSSGPLDIFQYRSTDGDFVQKKIIIRDGSSEREYLERVKLYELPPLQQMLRRNQLEPLHVFGDYDGQAYNQQTSPRIIMICQK